MTHPRRHPFDDSSNPFQDPIITSALNSHNQGSACELEPDPVNPSEPNAISFRQYSGTHDPFSSHKDHEAHDDSFQSSDRRGGDNPQTTLAAREEQLRQKERELAQREATLAQQQGAYPSRGNNFPPCFPLMVLDIPAEIPLEHQWTVWWLYREWLWFELTLVLNFIACLALLFSHPPSITSAPTDLGIALTEMFTHTVASFFLWFRPVYNAYLKEVSLYYYLYFAFNGCHILYTFYKAIGIPATGGAGLILVVTLFTEHYIGTAVLALLASLCWVGMAILGVVLYKKTYDHYKKAGHTLKDAKDDAYGRIGPSSALRDAAFNTAWNSR